MEPSMREIIMQNIRISALGTAFCLIFMCRTFGQVSDSVKNECDSLKKEALPALVQYIDSVAPNEENGDCITWAIRSLGDAKFEPAIRSLERLLDFRRPPTEREKKGFVLHPLGVWEIYPAAGALSNMGSKALPAVLETIESSSASDVSRENAVFVWMEIHGLSDEHPKAIVRLNQELINAKDDGLRERLRLAVR